MSINVKFSVEETDGRKTKTIYNPAASSGFFIIMERLFIKLLVYIVPGPQTRATVGYLV
jgi:hypothetical protein